MRILRAPTFHVAWAGVVVIGLLAAYRLEPYIFGLVSLVFAWATAAVAVAGLFMVVLSREASRRARLIVAGSLLLAGTAVAVALQLLRGFSWA